VTGREIFTLVPLAVIVIILGVYPHAILNLMHSSVEQLKDLVLQAPRLAQL